MSELHDEMAASVAALFADLAARELTFDRRWRECRDLGLPLVLVAEDDGGLGAGWPLAVAVMLAAGRSALAQPVAEMMLGGLLLTKAGVDPGDGAWSVAPATGVRDDGSRLTTTLRRVPWAADVERVVTVVDGADGPRIVAAETRRAEAVPVAFAPVEPRADIRLEAVEAADTPSPISAERLFAAGALLRAAAMAGAMQGALQLSVEYVSERRQFGRPISKFQAVQQQLALAGEECAAVTAAVRSAAGFVDGDSAFECGAAKLRANRAAAAVVATTHQVHGAIGFTHEYALRQYTQRLNAWSADYGNERYWAGRLGTEVLGAGCDFWAWLTARGDAGVD